MPLEPVPVFGKTGDDVEHKIRAGVVSVLHKRLKQSINTIMYKPVERESSIFNSFVMCIAVDY